MLGFLINYFIFSFDKKISRVPLLRSYLALLSFSPNLFKQRQLSSSAQKSHCLVDII